ncbi:MAG: selenide, water dikinase SelD, partial [Parvularculaceae bacterium]
MDQLAHEPRLTSLAHGGGCGCKLAPNVLSELLAGMAPGIAPKDLIIDAATSDDAAVWRVSGEAAIVATTDFFMPVVDDPFEFGRIAATNALSDVYAMGATPIFTLALVGMPIGKISNETIRKI